MLVVRKEFAATNYFLPGYWPHVALFLGTANDLQSCGLAEDKHVAPRLTQLAAATPTMAVLQPNETHAWSAGEPHPCVLEAMKDGVRIRSINSALNSDSVVVVRPRLEAAQVAQALAHGMMHEGKPYDFDFDFCYSHRLVCTEVVYRAYEGDSRNPIRLAAARGALRAGRGRHPADGASGSLTSRSWPFTCQNARQWSKRVQRPLRLSATWKARTCKLSGMSFEILDFPLVFFRGSTGPERAQIAARPVLGFFLREYSRYSPDASLRIIWSLLVASRPCKECADSLAYWSATMRKVCTHKAQRDFPMLVDCVSFWHDLCTHFA